ncbi:right-handed parallel beta-helix repeat-containing protein [bacterium]|nr:right-handed parallel beta-helix repeat-containing protein [bacterium]
MNFGNRQRRLSDLLGQVIWPMLVIVGLSAGANAAIAATPGVFNVRQYGAMGDGRTLDTVAINEAVEACAAAGGGQVLLPPGIYLSGTVHLKHNVTLFLDAGATLVGSKNLEHYQNFTPPAGTPESRWTRWHRALILGDGAENITIAGQGVIDGNKVFDPKGEEKMRGPHTILLGICRNITIRDVSIKDSANYAIMLEFCQQVEVRNVKITGGWDGVHFRGWPGRPCRDVSILGCQFYTGDDAIAGRYWENVLISDCIVNSSCNGIRLIGPATHLIIRDCLFYGPGVHPHRSSNRRNMLSGIILQPGSWDATEGSLDDVLISDITMKNMASPLTIWLKPGNTGGRITVSRVTATGVYRAACSVESWAETPFTTVVFRDVNIEFDGGGTLEQARRPVKQPGVDARPLPAWGFYARNVKNLRFEDLRLSCAKVDLRPVLICDGVERLKLDSFKFSRPAGALEALVLNDVAHVQLRDTDIPTVVSRIVELKLIAADSAGRFIAGRPYSVSVTVENGGQQGLSQIELVAAGQKVTRWVLLRPNEKKEVVLKGLTAPGAGTYQVRAGNLSRSLIVKEPQ